MSDWLGWLFTEIAFRAWDRLGERNREGSFCDRLLDASHALGAWFYARGERA